MTDISIAFGDPREKYDEPVIKGTFTFEPIVCRRCQEEVRKLLLVAKGIKLYGSDEYIGGEFTYYYQQSGTKAIREYVIRPLSETICHRMTLIFFFEGGPAIHTIGPPSEEGEKVYWKETDYSTLGRASQYHELEKTTGLLATLSDKEWRSEEKLGGRDNNWSLKTQLELLTRIGFIHRPPNSAQMLWGITTRGIKFLRDGIIGSLSYDARTIDSQREAMVELTDGFIRVRGALAALRDSEELLLLPESTEDAAIVEEG